MDRRLNRADQARRRSDEKELVSAIGGQLFRPHAQDEDAMIDQEYLED